MAKKEKTPIRYSVCVNIASYDEENDQYKELYDPETVASFATVEEAEAFIAKIATLTRGKQQ